MLLNFFIERQHLHHSRQQQRIHRRIRQIRVRGFDLREIHCVGRGRIDVFCLVMRLHEIEAEGPDEQRRVAFPLGNVSCQLRRIHRFRRREITAGAHVVEQRQRQQRQSDDDDPQIARTRADLQFVDQVLNQL